MNHPQIGLLLILCLSLSKVQAIPTGNGAEFIPPTLNLGVGIFSPEHRLAVNGAAFFSEHNLPSLPDLSGPGGLIYVDGSHLFFKSPIRTGLGFQLDFDNSSDATFNNPTFTGNVVFNPTAAVSGLNSIGTLNGNNLIAQNIINGTTLIGDTVKVNQSLTSPLVTAPIIVSNTVFFNQNGGNLWGNNIPDSYRKYYKQVVVSAASPQVLTDSDGAPLSRLKSYKLTAWTNGTERATAAVAYVTGDGLVPTCVTALPTPANPNPQPVCTPPPPATYTLRREYQAGIRNFHVKFFLNDTTGVPTIALFNDVPANLDTPKLVKILVEETPHFGLSNYPFGVNQAMSVNTAGNIGVGIESPTEKLEVAGNVKATGFIGNIPAAQLTGTIPNQVISNVVSIDSLTDAISTSATNSTFLGSNSGSSVASTSLFNTGLGINSLSRSSIGNGNTAVGYKAVNNSLENGNTGMGSFSLGAIGASSEYVYPFSYTVPDFCPPEFIGPCNWTTYPAVTFRAKSYNSAIGYGSLGNINTGYRNLAAGVFSGFNLNSGRNNTMIGADAGIFTTTGSNNIIIGNGSDTSSATASNELNIGKLIYGNVLNDKVGINMLPNNIQASLHVNGNILLRNSDDITYTTITCNSTIEGSQRYNKIKKIMEFCDASAWRPVTPIVQRVTATNTSYTTTTVVIPVDNTIPQQTEGLQIFSVTITPKNVNNTLRLTATIPVSISTAGTVTAAIFRDPSSTNTNAIVANAVTASANFLSNLVIIHELSVGALTPTTFTLRFGPNVGTARMNGFSTVRTFGGVSQATLTIEEIAQ